MKLKSLFSLLLLIIPMSTVAGDKKISLEDAVLQSQDTIKYLSLAMNFSIKSMETMAELVSDEQGEQRKKLSAALAELESNRSSDNLDSKTIEGINDAGAAMRELKYEATQDKEQTKKLVRKAYGLSGLVLAMDVVAAESIKRDMELLNEVIKDNSGFKALKNPTTVKHVKTAKQQIKVFKAFSEALPDQKDNFVFVRKTCKTIADEQNFSLMADIDPKSVATLESANAIAESEDID